MSALEEILDEAAENCREEGMACELMISLRDYRANRKNELAPSSFQFVFWRAVGRTWEGERHIALLEYCKNMHDRVMAQEAVVSAGCDGVVFAKRALTAKGIDCDYSILVVAVGKNNARSCEVCDRLADTIDSIIPS